MSLISYRDSPSFKIIIFIVDSGKQQQQPEKRGCKVANKKESNVYLLTQAQWLMWTCGLMSPEWYSGMKNVLGTHLPIQRG